MTPENNPLVSIIVRTKDRPKLLKRALASIAAQTYRPIEVVLVNDGGCELDLQEIKAILGNVRLNYIKLEKNVGRPHAGNVGIGSSKGQYLGFLDDDDEFYPEHIETLSAFLQQSDYKVAYTDSLMVYSDYSAEELKIKDNKSNVIFSEDFDFNKLIFENYIPFMCLLFESSVLSESGGIDGSFELYEDWDLLIRIGERYPFYHIKKVTAKYNQWSNEYQISQTARDPLFLRHCYVNILKKHLDKYTPARIHNYIHSFVVSRHTAGQDLKNRDELITHLNENLKDKDVWLLKLQAETGAEIERLKHELEKRDERARNFEIIMGDKDDHILNLEFLIEEKDALISAMQNTKGWRILEKYRRMRNYLLPPESALMRRLGLARKGVKTLSNEGWKVFIHKVNKRFLFQKSIKRTDVPIEICEAPPLICVEKQIDSKVSVIIPTKNAGDDFDYTLRKIVQQEGVRDIELIIVDSGSSDRTVEISRHYTQKVFEIPSKEFHHAVTRNLGAEKATGDALVFFVQDAIPVSSQWLYKLILPIYEGKTAAVSPKQIPRSDADLFACWCTWGHNLYMGYDKDYIVGESVSKNFAKMDIQQKRSVASLNNVCLGIRSEVFNSYRFQSGYAEDLELGLKLVEGGYPLMFQSTNAVIHSHTRPSSYFLKRGYIDTMYLSKMLGLETRNLPMDPVLGALSYVYAVLCKNIAVLNRAAYTKSPDAVIHSFLNILAEDLHRGRSTKRDMDGDPVLDDFFREIAPVWNENHIAEIMASYKADLLSFANFLKAFSTIEGLRPDFTGSLYKFFSNTAGCYLGANTSERLDSLYGDI